MVDNDYLKMDFSLEEKVLDIIDESDVEFHTYFNRHTVACCQLPNGEIITKSYDYDIVFEQDEDVAYDACMQAIYDEIAKGVAMSLEDDMDEFDELYEDIDKFADVMYYYDRNWMCDEYDDDDRFERHYHVGTKIC